MSSGRVIGPCMDNYRQGSIQLYTSSSTNMHVKISIVDLACTGKRCVSSSVTFSVFRGRPNDGSLPRAIGRLEMFKRITRDPGATVGNNNAGAAVIMCRLMLV